MATHSNILAWKIPWTEEPGTLQSIGSQELDTDYLIPPNMFTFYVLFRTELVRFNSYLFLFTFKYYLAASQILIINGLPRQLIGKESCGFNHWVRKIPWRRKWQATPVLLPGKSHGQRSLVRYSPWDCKDSDMTERLHFHFLSLFKFTNNCEKKKRKDISI